MRTKLLLTFSICYFTVFVYGQDSIQKAGINIQVQYHQEFILGGHIQVREDELEGDRLNLKELGMTSYPTLHLHASKVFKKGNFCSVTYEQYFMKGTSVFDKDIAYNGTIIDGTRGTDVSPTLFYRLRFNYYGNIIKNNSWVLQFMAGLVYDYTKFYIDGEIRPYSPRQEVYENFGKQALPYPEIGISTSYLFQQNNILKLDLSGTYIPKFKSFFKEGGAMYLQYSTIMTDLSYTRKFAPWEFIFGAKLRNVHLFGESNEDTNDLSITAAAPYLGISYWF